MYYIESIHGEKARALRNTLATVREKFAGYGISAAKIDSGLLAARDSVHAPAIAELHDRLTARRTFLDNLRTMAEGGKIAVIESGMDCDCSSYTGRVHIIDATVEAYNALDERTGEWADGPYSFELARPSDAARVKHRSRDLALEAYENGHAHRIDFAMPEGDPRDYDRPGQGRLSPDQGSLGERLDEQDGSADDEDPPFLSGVADRMGARSHL